jgi:pimeloyl-ACP methyl ester carboxylesterase
MVGSEQVSPGPRRRPAGAVKTASGAKSSARLRGGMVWGRHDPILKAEWVDVLPDAFETVSIDIADGCGHFVHYEDPDLAAREIEAFFADLERP